MTGNKTYGPMGNPKSIKQWLVDGDKMLWWNKTKGLCLKPYNFKNDGYVTTPVPVGDYWFTVDEND